MNELFDKNICYLEINHTCDSVEELIIYNLVINLNTNCLESATIEKDGQFYTAYREEFPLEIWAKVVDGGTYYLLDEYGDPIYFHKGYVPRVFDFYNKYEGYGDYIDLTLQKIGDKYYVNHKEQSIPNDYIDESEWTKMTSCKINSDYSAGYQAGISFIKNQVSKACATDVDYEDIIKFILNYEGNNT